LSPQEFHQALQEGWDNDTIDNIDNDNKKPRKEMVVIDVRNTFEHAIGRFQISTTSTTNSTITSITNGENKNGSTTSKPHVPHAHSAIQPEMVTFSTFDSNFCAKQADYLKDKKVLLYCTGGIRCEKASAMLRKRGVDDVSQLSGGIHNYLEAYPNTTITNTDGGGYFQGKNFVFDQRVALAATAAAPPFGNGGGVIVGHCLECHAPYDQLSGARLCTVCRDLVLICPNCTDTLREYHCQKHGLWKDYYFTFLEVYDQPALEQQAMGLTRIRNGLDNARRQKNVRRTLLKQIQKINARIEALNNNNDNDGTGTNTAARVVVESMSTAPKRCRTCTKPNDICDGLCWGFWKRTEKNGSPTETLPI
jgi:predicted sulfurtransferase